MEGSSGDEKSKKKRERRIKITAHERKDDESRVLPIGFATERSDATPERS